MDEKEDRPVAGEPAPSDEKQSLLEAQTRQCQEAIAQLQRLAAEFSNYQKRMQRVIEDERFLAAKALLADLLPVVDNFERAIEHAGSSAGSQGLLEGVRLVYEQLLAGLRKHGITAIEAAGKAFDPHVHEAVAHVPSDTHPAGAIVAEMQKGYRMGDRILRASRVAVSSGPPEIGEQAGQNGGDESDKDI